MESDSPLNTIPENLVSHVHRMKFHKNECIIHDNEENHYLYFVLSGNVTVRKNLLNGDCVQLKGVLRKGNCFGELELFSNQSNTYEVIAITECEVAYLPYNLVKDWMKEDFVFIQYLFQEVNDKLQNSSKSIIENKSGTAFERFLLFLYKTSKAEKTIPIKKEQLALSLNTSTRNLNRAIYRAKEEGIISLNKNQITILSEQKLHDYLSQTNFL